VHVTPVQESCPPSTTVQLIPRIEESLDNCGHLFGSFREYLEGRGQAGIVAVHFTSFHAQPGVIARSVALFIRTMGKRLTGKIEGGYKANPGEFFLLLAPVADYTEKLFNRDVDVIRRELGRHFALPRPAGRGVPPGLMDRVALKVEGVYLVHRPGDNVDNALFRAFQQLFGSSSPHGHHKTAEQSEIEGIIGGELITPVYQPIISLSDGAVFGYEALSRINAPGMGINPEELFAAAGKYGLTYPLEMLCRKKALETVSELDIPGRIFLNVCPTIVQTGRHERGITAALLESLQIERSRIVFELTERTIIEDYELFNRALSHYREQGYSIAIDDLGSGYAGLKMLAKLEPEYVKLAHFLIASIDTSYTRQALVEALGNFCGKIGATVIAEGIERKEELDFLISAGVKLGQGYLLGKPSPQPAAL
jgi:EAL domain-containing protein (putative c-di-GMP-specific phosphodiesterase class I)